VVLIERRRWDRREDERHFPKGSTGMVVHSPLKLFSLQDQRWRDWTATRLERASRRSVDLILG
jgi:hypothetical protein